MEDTELYSLAEVLEPLSKVEDVRDVIEAIVFEDKVLFNKASQILKGGKLGERSHSQNSHLRNPQSTSNDYMAGIDLSQQSGDLNEEEKDKADQNLSSKNEPALSYFKSFNSSIRKSRTGNNLGPRGGSQRNSHNDPDHLHFMPNVNSMKLHPSVAVKNGWVSKGDKETHIPNNDPLSHSTSKSIGKSQNKYATSSLGNYSEKSGSIKPLNSQIYFKKVDGKHSSVARTYRTKMKQDSSSLGRYNNLSNRNTNEFRTVRRKRELMLFSVNKNGRNHKLENKFRTVNHSPEGSPGKRPQNVGYSKNHRNYLNKMVMKSSKSPGSILGNLGNQDGSLRISQIGSNTNHRASKMTRFTSSKNLPSFANLGALNESGKKDLK